MNNKKAVLIGMTIVAVFLGFLFFGAVIYNHGRDLDFNKFLIAHCQTVNKTVNNDVPTTSTTTKYECGAGK